MSLYLYNSLTRTKEEFKPLVDNQVGMYVCGPTVYSPSHLGHAKSYITFDILAKFLRWKGYKLRYVQNITDVGHLTDNADEGEDKIVKQARLEKVHPWEIVDNYMRMYFEDMENLYIVHPNFYVRASQHIPEQIEAIQGLIKKGHAYEVNGSVYFDVSSFPEYGKLSGRILDEQLESVRIERRSEKRNVRDFALWKKAEKGHILRWNSPWGEGYPGWHIECSVMATKYLGNTIDIHGGGIENMFPHHECEIAQSEALTGQQFVRYWIHNNMVLVNGVKMSKSLGNYKTIRDLLAKHSAEAIRMFILSSHYRSTTNYTEDAIESVKTGLNRLSNCYSILKFEKLNILSNVKSDGLLKLEEELNSIESRIINALENDLDTPAAIATIFDLVTFINKRIQENTLTKFMQIKALEIFEFWAGKKMLGILPNVKNPYEIDNVESTSKLVELLVQIRHELKINKLYQLADKIRDELKSNGIILEDHKDGTRWRKL